MGILSIFAYIILVAILIGVVLSIRVKKKRNIIKDNVYQKKSQTTRLNDYCKNDETRKINDEKNEFKFIIEKSVVIVHSTKIIGKLGG